MDSDTIVAISTPPGRGGIGIVRLSGPHVRAIAAPMLRLKHELSPGRARLGELLDLGILGWPTHRADSPRDEWGAEPRILDQIVVTFFAAPHSYTGEDVIEIAMHGAPVLLEHVVRQCCTPNATGLAARLAEPGEFTQRAFLSGRIDLTQAEAVGDLIHSSTIEQARLAARQMGGSLARTVAPAKSALVALIASLEAGIDFAEDDIDVLPAAAIATQIAAIREPIAALERSFSAGRILREGFSLAIVGRPNAGKSSLFNRLVQRDRAIVTATPGTTRDLVTETVAISGIPVRLIDTAGLRDAADEAERIGIAKTREAMAEADVVLLVVDAAAAGMAEEDRAVLARAQESGSAALVVLNKVDLVQESRCDTLADEGAIATCAITGEGIDALRTAILRAIEADDSGLRESGLLTNLRQHQAVAQALKGLDAAAEAVAAATPHEMLLLDLYESLRALDALTGATTNEDVLRLIFSTFCIGK